MSETLCLLDTPKKHSLHSQSLSLRASLKEFEKSFTVEHGHKPTRDDIKAHDEVAAQYKTYNRIRDVLAGKLSYEEYTKPADKLPKKVQHQRVDSGLSWTPQNERFQQTPRKQFLPHDIDPYDAPSSISPRPLLFTAIGPTPQRDGHVLGLFDMIPSSTEKSQTPASASRKRKIDVVLDDNAPKILIEHVTQTPGRKSRLDGEDILQHLAGTPSVTPRVRRYNHSRTPISEGRKFMLSQFFATPSTVRHDNVGLIRSKPDQTPLRDRVLGATPTGDRSTNRAIEATPAYLKRTTSFKDRLRSVTNAPDDNSNLQIPEPLQGGPPTLLHFRAASKPLSQIVNDLRDIEEGDHDDDLDALRELESAETNVLMNQNQNGNPDKLEGMTENSNAGRTWKKRGQKRSTKRTRIRPAMAKIAEAPKFVTAEDSDDEEVSHDEVSEGDVQHGMAAASRREAPSKAKSKSNQWAEDEFSDSFYSDLDEIALENVSQVKQRTDRQATKKTKNDADKKKTESKVTTKVGKINPNAQSHMNFRTLKIRNKNSKAKGAGRRFGRR